MADCISPLDNILHSTSTRTLQYERQLKELEVNHLEFDIRPNLTLASFAVETFRTPEQLESNRHLAKAGVRRHSSEIRLALRPSWPCSPKNQRNVRRTDRAIGVYVPHINRAFDDALKSLSQLETTLPVTRAQISEIRSIYDSGRVKVCFALPDNVPWVHTAPLGARHG